MTGAGIAPGTPGNGVGAFRKSECTPYGGGGFCEQQRGSADHHYAKIFALQIVDIKESREHYKNAFHVFRPNFAHFCKIREKLLTLLS
jgi:hypothetical protein